MRRFTTARDRKQGAVAIIGCVFLFTAFGVLVYGRFATSVGAAALYNRASVGVGFILFGISMLCFTPMVYLQRMHRRRIDPAVLARELKGILLGFFCYVVPFFLAMGALSSADTTGVFGLVLMVAFGAIPFVYRRHRKKDPISYKHTGSAAIVAFCGVFAVISIAGGAFSCSEMLDDLNGGWRQERFAFYEAEINKPRGRGAALSPTTFEVSLYRDGESVANHRVDARLSVNAADWPEVALVLDEPMAPSWARATWTVLPPRATRSSRGRQWRARLRERLLWRSPLTPGRRSEAAVRRGRLSSRVNGAVVRSARPRACTAPGAAGAPCSWPRSWLPRWGWRRSRSAWPRWPSADWRSPSPSRFGRSAARGEGPAFGPGSRSPREPCTWRASRTSCSSSGSGSSTDLLERGSHALLAV